MDDIYIYGCLIILFILFSLLKSAFRSFNHLQLELDKKKVPPAYKGLFFLSNHLSEIKLSVSIYRIIILVLLISKIVLDFNKNHPYSFPIFSFTSLFLFVGTILLIGICIVLRSIGEYFPNKTINIFSPVTIFFYLLAIPISKLIFYLIYKPFNLFHEEDPLSTNKKNFDLDDLNKLVQYNHQHGAEQNTSADEIKMFKNALEFSEVKIRDCMLPRTEIVSVEYSDISTELRDKFITTGLSRIIIYKDSIDNIIGYIKSNSLFSLGDILQNIRSLAVFPETMPANKLLRYFIRTGQSLVIVVDEFGGTSGIISLEDILEEIFGEIQDEHDKVLLFEKKISDTEYIFSGRIEIDYLNDKYELSIPDSDDYETLAGFILNSTESIPQINQQIIIDNFNFTILKVSNIRVETVKLEVKKAYQ